MYYNSFMNNVHLHIVGSKSFPALLNELNLNYIITSDTNLKYNHKDLLIRIIFAEKLKLERIWDGATILTAVFITSK